MILGPAVVENKLSGTQRAEAYTSNATITTSIIGVPVIVDEAPEMVIYK